MKSIFIVDPVQYQTMEVVDWWYDVKSWSYYFACISLCCWPGLPCLLVMILAVQLFTSTWCFYISGFISSKMRMCSSVCSSVCWWAGLYWTYWMHQLSSITSYNYWRLLSDWCLDVQHFVSHIVEQCLKLKAQHLNELWYYWLLVARGSYLLNRHRQQAHNIKCNYSWQTQWLWRQQKSY